CPRPFPRPTRRESGLAPARYGDLSDGAVIIERQAGRTPTFVRVQARNNATSYGVSKGLVLSPKLGHLNVDLSYVNSFADNRDKRSEEHTSALQSRENL